jgi:hypothetical protein
MRARGWTKTNQGRVTLSTAHARPVTICVQLHSAFYLYIGGLPPLARTDAMPLGYMAKKEEEKADAMRLGIEGQKGGTEIELLCT